MLKVAVRYGRIDRNPAEDARLPQPRFKGSYLDRAEHVAALLDAAGALDRERRLRVGHGRALLATLALAGLRIDEALSLRWRDVDLAAGTLSVVRSKTDAGERVVDLLPLLRDELLALRLGGIRTATPSSSRRPAAGRTVRATFATGRSRPPSRRRTPRSRRPTGIRCRTA